jgi:4-hydroxy-3-polyprenylbenzoate decarboxylase
MRALVGLTGASGALYGLRIVQRLLDSEVETEVILTAAARRVLAVEQGLRGDPQRWLSARDGRSPRLLGEGDIEALPASGSRAPDVMFIAPCSMGTAARVLAGVSGNLIERAADVMLKERRPLVIVPRETPLSTLHLRNLMQLSELGVRVVPAMPGFYFGPTSIEGLIEFVVDRAIQSSGLEIPLRHPWTGSPSSDDEPTR